MNLSAYVNRNQLVAISYDDGASIVLPDGRTFGMAGREAAWTEIDLDDVADLTDAQVAAVQAEEELRAARAARTAQVAAERAQAQAERDAYWASPAGQRELARQHQMLRLLRRTLRGFTQAVRV